MKTNALTRKWSELPEDAIKQRQMRAFRHYLKTHVLPFSAHYRELFEQHGLHPEDFQSLHDLGRIPFTTKADISNTPENPQRTRDFILIPDQKVLAKRPSTILRAVLTGKQRVKRRFEREYRPIFMTSTTGRSSEPVPFLYTSRDLDNLRTSGIRMMEVSNTTPDQRTLNIFPYAPHLAFWQMHYASTASGTFCLSTGGGKVMGTEGNIRLLNKINPDAIIGMPTFLYHVFSQGLEEGNLKVDNLRTIVLGGEKAPDGLRRKLREFASQAGAKNVHVLATYGFTEAKTAWVECPFPHDDAPSGYHLYPDLGILEIIDPDTGELQPDGHPGEIVYTSLDSRGSVVLRYRTGDITDGGLTYEPCPHCHRSMPRLTGRITRRTEVMEMSLDKLKGTLVDFNKMEQLLEECEGVGAWQVELRKRNDDPMEIDELVVHIQPQSKANEDHVRKQLNTLFPERLEITPNRIEFHSSEEMRSLHGVGSEMKEKKIADNRPKADDTDAAPGDSGGKDAS